MPDQTKESGGTALQTGGHNPWSASNMIRRFLCSGSYLMEKGQPDPPSEESETGDRIHLASHTGDDSALVDDERETLQRWNGWKESQLEGMGEPETEVYGVLKAPFDGTADVRAVSADGRYGLILDLKTGWFPLDPHAVSFQGSIYAAIFLLENPEMESCEAMMRSVRMGETYGVRVERHQIDGVILRCQEVREKNLRQTLELNPTAEGCRYCKARHFCPALGAMQDQIERVEEGIPVENIAALYEMAKLVERRIDYVKKLMRTGLEHGGVPGYNLKERKGNRFIPSDELTEFFTRLGYPMAEAFKFLKVTPGEVKKDWVSNHKEDHGGNVAKTEREFWEKVGDCARHGKPSFAIAKTKE